MYVGEGFFVIYFYDHDFYVEEKSMFLNQVHLINLEHISFPAIGFSTDEIVEIYDHIC